MTSYTYFSKLLLVGIVGLASSLYAQAADKTNASITNTDTTDSSQLFVNSFIANNGNLSLSIQTNYSFDQKNYEHPNCIKLYQSMRDHLTDNIENADDNISQSMKNDLVKYFEKTGAKFKTLSVSQQAYTCYLYNRLQVIQDYNDSISSELNNAPEIDNGDDASPDDSGN